MITMFQSLKIPPVARLLFKKVEIGHYIPKDAFKIVAEILAFVFNLKNEQKKII